MYIVSTACVSLPRNLLWLIFCQGANLQSDWLQQQPELSVLPANPGRLVKCFFRKT